MTHELLPLFSALQPTRRHKIVALAVAVALLLTMLAALPFRELELPRQAAFIPLVDAFLFFNCLITAVLLYAQLSVSRRLGLRLLAGSYVFMALIIVSHALTFPGTFSTEGLFGGSLQSEMWLYIFWHAGLPAAAIAYAVLKGTHADQLKNYGLPVAPIYIDMAVAVGVVAILTWLAVAGADWQPSNANDAVYLNFISQKVGASLLLCLIIAAMIFVGLRRSSALDLWLLVALWAWCLEVILLAMTSYRISVVWYVGRLFSLVSSFLVMIVLLVESTKLYSQVTASAETKEIVRAAQGSETMDVMLKSIAHDLLQRLSAIMANGSAGVLMLKRNPQNPAELRATFEDIVNEGRNAAKIVDSIRSIYTAASISTSKYPEQRH